MNKEEALAQLRKDWGDCRRCRLCETRKNLVFGSGNPSADILVIGEGPGETEDKLGLPFRGASGEILNRFLDAAQIDRIQDLFITNVVSCLRYNTQVLLADGSWKRIGNLVRERYAGKVMSVDEYGHIVPKAVTDWHATPVMSRSMYKLSCVSLKTRGGYKAVTWLTEDHKVKTTRGWVRADKLRNNDLVAVGSGLTRIAKEVLEGTVLGDAHIDRRSGHISIRHCQAQKEYALLKANALKELNIVVNDGVQHKDGKSYPYTDIRSLAHRSIQVMRNRFYPNGTKTVPEDLRFTPISFCMWFLDNGHTTTKSDDGREGVGSGLAEIAAHAFSDEGIQLLINKLWQQLGLRGYTRATAPGRIFFRANDTYKLSEMIAPYCPESMRYKLHPRVRSSVPFEPKLLRPSGLQETLYDQITIEHVPNWGSDRTVYCLDVEDTHCFVTSGGVVHNCWPYHIIKDERSGKDVRETRSPTKEEKLACRERLMKTIYIIDPMIIVALGKTAMQALTGKGTVITKARGEILVMEMQGVHTKVRYPVLPIYHPAYLARSGDFTDDGPWHTTELDFGLLCQVVDHLREKYYRKVPPERDRRHEQQKEDEDRDHD